MEKNKFSVAMCVYGGDTPEHFDTAVSSVLNQTLVPNEIVLVVDGPIGDNLNTVVEKYEKECAFFKVIRLPQNGGLGNALRVSLENCSYELVARMDSDDIALPYRFEEQMKFFADNPEVDIVGGDISEFVDTEDNIVAYRKVPTKDFEIKEYLKFRCPLNHVTVMYKKSFVIKAGGYLDLHYNEDYYLWIRMFEAGYTMANTGTVLVNVRTGADMYSRRGGKRYFESERFLQKYMLSHGIINKSTYIKNISKRWIVQRCMPNFVRGWVFKKFARD